MNPLVATVVAIVVNLLAGGLALLLPARESRAVALAGASVLVGAAAFSAFPLLFDQQPVVFGYGGVALQADALTGTLLMPLGLAVAAFAIAGGDDGRLPRRMASLSWALSAATLALVADNLALLLGAEVVGALALMWAVPRRIRSIRGTLGLAALLMVVAAGAALAAGSLLRPFGEGPAPTLLVAGLVLAAAAARLGLPPFQVRLTAAFQEGIEELAPALLAPIGGLALVIRVVQPALAHAGRAEWVELGVLAVACLAALAAVGTTDLGRGIGWLLSALFAFMVAGNLGPSEAETLGGGLLWAAMVISGAGLGLAVAMVVRRLGPVDLRTQQGLHAAAPRLSLAFLLVALTVAGAPGTLEFVAEDILLNGLHAGGLLGTLLTVGGLSAVGFAAVRASFQTFFGAPAASPGSLDISTMEQRTLLMMVFVVVAGGVAPGLLPLVARAAGASLGG